MKSFEEFFEEHFIWKKCGFISIFDHWLTASEADNCNILNYETSSEKNANLDYLLGESKFINFYKNVSDIVICKVEESFKELQTNSNEFENLLISSLREENLKFLDIFYPKLRIRCKGGFDRTDQFFLADERNFHSLKEHAEKNKLFILNYENFNLNMLD